MLREGQPASWRVLWSAVAWVGASIAVWAAARFFFGFNPTLDGPVGHLSIAFSVGFMVLGAANRVRRARAALAVGLLTCLASLSGGVALAASLLSDHYRQTQTTFGVIGVATALLTIAAFTVTTRIGDDG